MDGNEICIRWEVRESAISRVTFGVCCGYHHIIFLRCEAGQGSDCVYKN